MNNNATAVRRAARAAAVTFAVLVLTGATPAFADTPETWSDRPEVSTLEVLLIFVGVPVLLFGVIWLLADLPNMVKAQRQGAGDQAK